MLTHGNETEIGINGFKAYRSYWWEHPDRDDAWKEEELGRIGEERFRREHGCEFIINDETLIDSLILTNMIGTDPISKQGTVRWYAKPKKGMTYLVALDPSLGTGGDPAAIQVIEAPSMIQVAEWRHNKTPIPEQIKILHQICNIIAEETDDRNSVYYSVENNTIGEAALISIADIGEENFPGVFLSETKGHGNSRRFRKGFNTTQRSKLTTCSKLKTLVESSRLTINSKLLVSELKNFIASGGSYAAKIGETDDLVMSTILALRMATELRNFLPEIDSQIRDSSDSDIQPMPFVML
jgi:hypothetical protein